jgi:hypothetical protein
VLGFASGVRHREEELRRAFFCARFVRVLDSLGYTRFRHWKIYGEEALAGREAALWLAAESLTVEHGGEPLSRYRVRLEADTGELRSVEKPRLFENSHGLRRPQRRLFALDSLGEGGWLKALRLEGGTLRERRDDPRPSNRRSSPMPKPSNRPGRCGRRKHYASPAHGARGARFGGQPKSRYASQTLALSYSW